MNPQTLDSHLRALTQGETRNLSGNPFTFDNYPTKEISNGEHCLLFGATDIAEPFYVQKNSRFNNVPLHVHSWVELNYMYSGKCDQYINGENALLRTHQISLIDSNAPHSLGYTGNDDIMINIVISRSYLNTNFFNRMSQDSFVSRFFIKAISQHTQHNNYMLFEADNSRKIPIFMNEFLCEYFDPSVNSRDILDSLFILILSELINVMEKDMHNQKKHSAESSIIPILRYIESNYKTCTLENTASFFNLNANYLTTLLKQQTGHSYKELVLQQRMTSAARLLKTTDWPVTKVAEEIGYENISFFYRKFQERYQISPKEYRRGK